MTNNYFITGEKVGLRAFEKSDLEIYAKWLNDKAVTKYLEMGWRPVTDKDLEAVYMEATDGKSAIVFVVCDLETHKPIGTTGFYFLHWPGRRAQYRILIGESAAHGKGFGSEVNKLMVKHGFERLNFHTIYLGVNAENTGAIKSYEKAGYIHEGRHRDFVYNDGKYYDSLSMSILSSDYFGQQG